MTFRLPVHRIVRYTLYCTSVLGLFGDRTFRGSVIDSGIYLLRPGGVPCRIRAFVEGFYC
jgi:hypothetical protein